MQSADTCSGIFAHVAMQFISRINDAALIGGGRDVPCAEDTRVSYKKLHCFLTTFCRTAYSVCQCPIATNPYQDME